MGKFGNKIKKKKAAAASANVAESTNAVAASANVAESTNEQLSSSSNEQENSHNESHPKKQKLVPAKEMIIFTAKVEFNYLVENRLTTQEENVIGECSRYVQERVYAIKLGRTDTEGMSRLSSLMCNSSFNLRILKFKSGDSKSIESFWKAEFALQNIRGEWFSLSFAQKERFMTVMQEHVNVGCKLFMGKNTSDLKDCWRSLVTNDNERQQWKDTRDAEVTKLYAPTSNTPAPGFDRQQILSPNDSFNSLLPQNSHLCGVTRGGESKADQHFMGKKVTYAAKILVPQGVTLTDRDHWLIGGRIKCGSTDNPEQRRISIQVSCSFDIEMMYFEVGYEYCAVEEVFKTIFDLQNHHGEWFHLLRSQLNMYVSKTLHYLQSSSDEQVTPIIGRLDQHSSNEVTRFACFQVNGMSDDRLSSQVNGMSDDRLYSRRSCKIEAMTSCISNNHIDVAGLVEIGIDWRKIDNKLSDFFSPQLKCTSSVSHNMTDELKDGSGCGQPGGTGHLSIIPFENKNGGDRRGLGRYNCIRIGNTTVITIYGMSYYSTKDCYNSVTNQSRRYIAKNRIDTKSPRHLLNDDVLDHVKDIVNDGYEVIIMMDANECIHNGELCSALVDDANKLGLREITQCRVNTHDRGTEAHSGVWISSKLVLSGCALIKVVGDHKTPIFDITTESLGITESSVSRMKPAVGPTEDVKPRTLFGMVGPVTMQNYEGFVKAYDNNGKIIPSNLQLWDGLTRTILLTSAYTPPHLYSRWDRVERQLSTGGIVEEELYRILIGIKRYPYSAQIWGSIFNDHELGLHLTRSSNTDIMLACKGYLEKCGLWAGFLEVKDKGENMAQFIFGEMGLQYDNLPKHWYLTLSNKFLLGCVRKANNSDDRRL